MSHPEQETEMGFEGEFFRGHQKFQQYPGAGNANHAPRDNGRFVKEKSPDELLQEAQFHPHGKFSYDVHIPIKVSGAFAEAARFAYFDHEFFDYAYVKEAPKFDDLDLGYLKLQIDQKFGFCAALNIDPVKLEPTPINLSLRDLMNKWENTRDIADFLVGQGYNLDKLFVVETIPKGPSLEIGAVISPGVIGAEAGARVYGNGLKLHYRTDSGEILELNVMVALGIKGGRHVALAQAKNGNQGYEINNQMAIGMFEIKAKVISNPKQQPQQQKGAAAMQDLFAHPAIYEKYKELIQEMNAEQKQAFKSAFVEFAGENNRRFDQLFERVDRNFQSLEGMQAKLDGLMGFVADLHVDMKLRQHREQNLRDQAWLLAQFNGAIDGFNMIGQIGNLCGNKFLQGVGVIGGGFAEGLKCMNALGTAELLGVLTPLGGILSVGVGIANFFMNKNSNGLGKALKQISSQINHLENTMIRYFEGLFENQRATYDLLKTGLTSLSEGIEELLKNDQEIKDIAAAMYGDMVRLGIRDDKKDLRALKNLVDQIVNKKSMPNAPYWALQQIEDQLIDSCTLDVRGNAFVDAKLSAWFHVGKLLPLDAETTLRFHIPQCDRDQVANLHWIKLVLSSYFRLTPTLDTSDPANENLRRRIHNRLISILKNTKNFLKYLKSDPFLSSFYLLCESSKDKSSQFTTLFGLVGLNYVEHANKTRDEQIKVLRTAIDKAISELTCLKGVCVLTDLMTTVTNPEQKRKMEKPMNNEHEVKLKNHKLNSDSLKELDSGMKKIEPILEMVKDKEVTLFFGSTKVGKSTLINHVMGCDYVMDTSSGKLEAKLVRGKEICLVGKDELRSETLIPQIVQDDQHKMVWVDPAGIFDSRGEKARIEGTTNLHLICQAAKKVNFIALMRHNELESAAGDHFKKLLLAIGHAFNGHFEMIPHAVGFEINRCPVYFKPEHFPAFVDRAIKSYQSNANQTADDKTILNVLNQLKQCKVIIADVLDQPSGCRKETVNLAKSLKHVDSHLLDFIAQEQSTQTLRKHLKQLAKDCRLSHEAIQLWGERIKTTKATIADLDAVILKNKNKQAQNEFEIKEWSSRSAEAAVCKGAAQSVLDSWKTPKVEVCELMTGGYGNPENFQFHPGIHKKNSTFKRENPKRHYHDRVGGGTKQYMYHTPIKKSHTVEYWIDQPTLVQVESMQLMNCKFVSQNCEYDEKKRQYKLSVQFETGDQAADYCLQNVCTATATIKIALSPQGLKTCQAQLNGMTKEIQLCQDRVASMEADTLQLKKQLTKREEEFDHAKETLTATAQLLSSAHHELTAYRTLILSAVKVCKGLRLNREDPEIAEFVKFAEDYFKIPAETPAKGNVKTFFANGKSSAAGNPSSATQQAESLHTHGM